MVEDAKLGEISNIIQDEVKNSRLAGLAVGVVSNDELVYTFTQGVKENAIDIQIAENSVFMLGSITKLFTTIGIMQLWEEKRFKLDEAVNNYLPTGKIIYKKPSWPEVTFRHLLTHTSGIGELRQGRDLFKHGFGLITFDEEPFPDIKEFHAQNIYASAPAGQKWAYSNIGFSLLGYLIEVLTGKTYRDYIVEHILDPLEMDHSDLIQSPRTQELEVQGYKWKRGKLVRAKRWNNIIKPSGSLLSNLPDMAKFAAMLLNKGVYKQKRIIKEETLDLIWTPQYWSHPAFKDYYSMGFDFWRYNMNGKRVFEHTGSVSGFTAVFSFIPEEKIAFFSFSNLQEGLTSRITMRLRNRMIKTFTNTNMVLDTPTNMVTTSIDTAICGYYAAYPGWLSSTRIYTEGCDFKIFQKKGGVFFSSFLGDYRKSVPLYPTSDPDVYEFFQKNAAGDIFPTTKLGFHRNQDGKITGMGYHFEKVRKVSFFKTFRFKIYFWCLIFIFLLIWII